MAAWRDGAGEESAAGRRTCKAGGRCLAAGDGNGRSKQRVNKVGRQLEPGPVSVAASALLRRQAKKKPAPNIPTPIIARRALPCARHPLPPVSEPYLSRSGKVRQARLGPRPPCRPGVEALRRWSRRAGATSTRRSTRTARRSHRRVRARVGARTWCRSARHTARRAGPGPQSSRENGLPTMARYRRRSCSTDRGTAKIL